VTKAEFNLPNCSSSNPSPSNPDQPKINITATDTTLQKTERTMPGHTIGRDNMRAWLKLREENVFTKNKDFQHTVKFHLAEDYAKIHEDLTEFGALIPTTLDATVTEVDYRFNNPRIDPYNGIGDRQDKMVHHPDYNKGGNIIYGTGMVKKLTTLGGLRDGYSFYFQSHHVGEAGHHCPVICNYETARVLRLIEDFPGKEEYIAKLETPSYDDNYTSSQFLTEVQGGSDVGANDVRAWQDSDGNWFIRGEKWFCSNADAELMVISARRSTDRKGTKGLSMFLIPAVKPDGTRNDFTMRRLKEKLGTRALASAEIDYHDAWAIPLGDNFNFMLEKVVHHSRIALAVAVLGMNSRAYQLSRDFAETRHAFGTAIINYPLVQQNLAGIKADMTASLAGTFALIALQDKIDTADNFDADLITFSRLMVNIGKSVISKRNVDNVHHCIDGIGGNGAIENMSSMPRLLRDSVILENWEGTHNTLCMQVLRDIHRYQHDEVYLRVMADMIENIDSRLSDEQQLAQNALEELHAKISDFHEASHDLQTLKIAEILPAMANLFYYISLLAEGIHQQDENGRDSKLQCAKLYNLSVISENAMKLNDEYISLCKKIVAY